jgi:hypothetical protein
VNAANLVERHRAEVGELERAMLVDPDLIPVLRPRRDEARAMLAQAEVQVALAEYVNERRPTPSEAAALWADCRTLGRQRMSARTKAKAIKWFGPRRYRTLPW